MSSIKKYTSAEKVKIALEADKGKLTLAQTSSKYSVHATQINLWGKQLLASLLDVFGEKHKQEKIDHDNEIAPLYEQIRRLSYDKIAR